MSTVQYYNEHAEEYAADTFTADVEALRRHFLKYMPLNGTILDAGCGSGRDTVAFLKEGYSVDAFDASDEMCRIAAERTGIPVVKKRFEELNGEPAYNGIWACAALLHVKKEQLPVVLERLRRLLKPEGVLYASFKSGNGERMQGDRYFHDMTEEECILFMQNAGFTVLETFHSGDVRPGRTGEQWVNVIVRK